MSDYFGFVHDQARYYRCHLSRARSRLPLAKAAPEKTSVGARQAATGTVSEGARLAFCRGFRIAGFASGKLDPNAKVRSDCKTEAYADVAQTDADASPQPLMSPQTQQSRRSTPIFEVSLSRPPRRVGLSHRARTRVRPTDNVRLIG